MSREDFVDVMRELAASPFLFTGALLAGVGGTLIWISTLISGRPAP